MITKELSLKGTTVEKVDRGSLSLRGPHGTLLVLKNPWVNFKVQGDQAHLSYRQSYRTRMRGILPTWSSAVRRLVQDKEWSYRVTALFKHFPVSMIVQKDHVRVLNYFGVKKPGGQPRQFLVDTKGVVVNSEDPRNLIITSRDRVYAGNVASRFSNLRYKVHARKMDRRVFSDGFLVKLL